MSAALFVSYSRQESPFADSLLDELEDRGFKVWMDYQSLTPARPWEEEICRGIEEANVVLLVVSKASIVSKFTSAEIETAFELKKRILLIIFEAVELPPWLQDCEWVDFRRSFKKGLNDLLRQLESANEKGPAPQKGFAAPRLIWISFLVSLGVSSITLLSFWSLYLLYFLLPLPVRVLKRDFNFFHVQLALIILPFALFISIFLKPGNSDSFGLFEVYWVLSVFLSFILVPLMLLLLRSKSMRRWGKPRASRPTFANPYRPNVEKPRSVTFTVDAAPEDKRYCDDLIKGMEKYGHRLEADAQKAEVAFVLISRYKTDTVYNPEVRIVYPVLLQATRGIDPKVERVQWIDFRRGLKNLDALAQLIPEPAKIFKALGIAPIGNQTVLPPIIHALVVYLILLGIFTFGGWGIAVLQLRQGVDLRDILFLSIGLIIVLGSVFLTAKSLINRKGRMASLRYLIPVLIFGVGVSELYLTIHISNVFNSLPKVEGDLRGGIIMVNLLVYLIGLILIVPLTVWYWKDLRRWCPKRTKRKRRAA